jgi:hypothetical protein
LQARRSSLPLPFVIHIHATFIATEYARAMEVEVALGAGAGVSVFEIVSAAGG